MNQSAPILDLKAVLYQEQTMVIPIYDQTSVSEGLHYAPPVKLNTNSTVLLFQETATIPLFQKVIITTLPLFQKVVIAVSFYDYLVMTTLQSCLCYIRLLGLTSFPPITNFLTTKFFI